MRRRKGEDAREGGKVREEARREREEEGARVRKSERGKWREKE